MLFRGKNKILLSQESFTLAEMLVVVGILVILLSATVLLINPVEYFKQSRDVQRMSDLKNLQTAVERYKYSGNRISPISPLGSVNTIYTSLFDGLSSTCSSMGLPLLASGWSYHCVTSQASLQKIDGTGWIPVDLSNLGLISSLPIDPTNSVSANLYYSYMVNSSGSMELTATLESQKKLKDSALIDSGTDPAKYETGETLALWTQASGLAGYWPFNEGTGTTANDTSGNGRTCSGSINWGSGKMGTAITVPNYIACTTPSVITGAITYMAWVNSSSANGDIIGFMNYLPTWGYSMILLNSSPCLFFQDSGLTWRNVCGPVISNPLNQWHLVAVTNNGANTVFYLDGNMSQSISNPYTAGSSNNTTYVGLAGWYVFNGKIDDLRMYNRVLTATEIQNIYTATK